MLGKLPVPGRPTSLDDSRARTYCACNRCGWGLFGQFFSRLSFLFSFSHSLGDGPIYTEILSRRAVKPETINQPTSGTLRASLILLLNKCLIGPIEIELFNYQKADDKFSPANFQKILSPSYVIFRIKKLEGKQCRSR